MLGPWVQACSDHGGAFSIDQIPSETPAICPFGCMRDKDGNSQSEVTTTASEICGLIAWWP